MFVVYSFFLHQIHINLQTKCVSCIHLVCFEHQFDKPNIFQVYISFVFNFNLTDQFDIILVELDASLFYWMHHSQISKY